MGVGRADAVIKTHTSPMDIAERVTNRMRLAVGNGWWLQFRDQSQDVCEQVSRNCDLGISNAT
jgi:hypothetical protein